MNEPSTQIWLYNNIPFDLDYKNVVDFSNGNRQAYFNSRLANYYQNILYIEKNGSVIVPLNIGDLKNVNYVKYNNNNGEGDIYAFVINKKYINQGATRLDLKTDIWQTNLNNYVLKDSFVVREHTESDNVGEHLIDEGIPFGEHNAESYNIFPDNTQTLESANNYFYLVAISGEMLGDVGYRGFISNNLNAVYFYTSTVDNWRHLIELINTGNISSCLGIFLVPKRFLNPVTVGNIGYLDATSVLPPTTHTIPKPTTLNGYTPKNKKLLSYPYCFFEVETGNGTNKKYKYENFYSENCQLKIYFNLSSTPSICAIPLMYNKNYEDFSNSITDTAFPQISFVGDVFKNYMALNANTLSIKHSSMFIDSVLSASTPTGLISSSFNVLGEMGRMIDIANQPDTIKGNVSGYMSYTTNNQMFKIYRKYLSLNDAIIIDNFFTKFGYKVNELKTPNLTSRPYFNYIETRDVNIYGVPYEDLTDFKQIFNTGVTIWHDGNNYLNYQVENGVD